MGEQKAGRVGGALCTIKLLVLCNIKFLNLSVTLGYQSKGMEWRVWVQLNCEGFWWWLKVWATG